VKGWLVRSKSGLGGWVEPLSNDMPQKELNETGLGTPRNTLSLPSGKTSWRKKHIILIKRCNSENSM
jgi:hypothetical protein